MADEQQKRFCKICKKQEVYKQMDKFDLCFSCAGDEAERLYVEFFAVLSLEQKILFEAYKKAEETFTSMMFLH